MYRGYVPVALAPFGDSTALKDLRTIEDMSNALRISVIGTGYLGATHAAAMAEMGYSVVGIDIDEGKVERLSKGSVPFYEPGLDELITTHVDAGRLRFTT